jgi:hypothetical protein
LIGWFAGLVLLWTSALWSTRDKLIGTFVLPFGLALPLIVLTGTLTAVGSSCSTRGISDLHGNLTSSSSNCDHGNSLLGWMVGGSLAVGILLAPIATTIYLARRMNRRKLSLADT